MKFASLGADVAVTGSRPESEAMEALDKIRGQAHGSKVEYFQSDLGNPFDGCPVLIKDISERLGPVDILIQNAGVQHTSQVQDFPIEKWQLLMNLHLNATFMLMRLTLPHMQHSGWGRIINISSVHGKVASTEKSAYCAAKHAMNALTKVAALENAVGGVAINAICPGWVHTPLVQKQIQDLADDRGFSTNRAQRKLLEQKMPSRNFTSIDDIAEMCVFLCGPHGANMKGSLISMDGGWAAVPEAKVPGITSLTSLNSMSSISQLEEAI
jgi:3-hydroxybutyrate dehydrogenase